MIKYLLFIFLACCISGCTTGLDYSRQRSERLFRQGNLIPDSSFESDHGWTGSDCSTDSSTKHSGLVALKLEGPLSACFSPRIEVTPGHYEISSWLKFEGLELTEESDLHDAVQLNIHYYDRSGVEIFPRARFLEIEKEQTELNSALRGVNPKLSAGSPGFSKVYLRPHYYPLDSGWFPKNIGSIQFEFRVKESGRLWIDDFELKYSKWNFSLRERAELLDTEQLRIFPKPQLALESSSPYHFHERNQRWCLKAGQDERRYLQTSLAFSDLKFILGAFGILFAEDCETGSKVLLELKHAMPQDFPAAYRHNPEAYALVPQQNERFALYYNSTRGLEYGLQSFFQLFDSRKKEPALVHRLKIFDHPHYLLRSAGGKDSRLEGYMQEIMALRWLPESRFNTLFVELNSSSAKWWENSAQVLAASAVLGQADWRGGLVDFGLTINPYIHTSSRQFARELRLSDRRTIDEIFSVIEPHLKNGAREIILRADDFVPIKKDIARFAYYLDNSADRKVFGTLAKAQAHLVRQLLLRIKSRFPHAKLYFVPPWYANFFIDESNSLGRKYLQELGKLLPADVPVMWTGQSVRSLKIDRLQAARFKQYFPNNQIMLWDNTLYARRHKDFWQNHSDRVALNSFIEPFDVEMPSDIFPAGAYINSQVNPITRIQLATAGDYLWNPEQYVPELSLLTYLRLQFGRETSDQLLRFDELLWRLRRCSLLKTEKETCREHSAIEAELAEIWPVLTRALESGNAGLLDELRRRYLSESSKAAGKS